MNEAQEEHDTRPVPDPTRITTERLNEKAAALQELLQTKISGVDSVLKEQIKAMNDAVVLRRIGVDAALTEIREAAKAMHLSITSDIRHSEATTSSQFASLNTLIDSKTAGLDGKITLVTSRQDLGEGVGKGHDKDRAMTFAIIGAGLGVASLIIGIGVALFSIFGHPAPATAQPQIIVSPPTSISAPAK